jgi:plasmid stabilization system protein ParE
MSDPDTLWEVRLSDRAHTERDTLFLRVGQRRGADYARRWWDGLLKTTDSLAEFPGPRSYPRSIEESECRRAEVRVRLYGGPDKKSSPTVSCHIFFALYDPQQGEDLGRVIVLRVIGAGTQEAQDVLLGVEQAID